MNNKINAALSLLLTVSLYANAGVYTGSTDDQTYQYLLSELNNKYKQLNEKIDEAEALGLTTDYAQVSQVTIRLFKDTFAPWDKENIAQVQAMYDANYFGRYDPSGAQALPFDELADSIEVADNALMQLNDQINGEIRLASSPDFSGNKIKLEGAHYQLNGKPVIVGKFFWQPLDQDIMKAYGTGGESYYAVQDLSSENELRQYRHSNFINRVKQEDELGRQPVQFFLGHIVPKEFWLREQYPQAFSQGNRLFTDYDIDNPNLRPLLTTLFEKQLALGVAELQSTERVHMIANEPTFSIRQGGVNADLGLSDFTFDKFKVWLTDNYQNIEALNLAYKTKFTSFEQAANGYDIPLPLSYQGSAIWYDWHRFNMDRVNEWFEFLHQGVKQVDPNGQTHIKLMGERAIHTNYHDEGLDFEFVTKLVDMPGSDNQASPLAAQWDVRHTQDWRERYSFEWRAQAIMLDFVKSLAPNKLFYDSEWHGLSGARWRDFHMSPEFVRSIMWLSVADGLGALTSWVWNRKADGSIDPRADFIGTSVTQPIQLDAYGRALKEINAHGDKFAALVPKKRYLMIYFSQDSAIQDASYSGKMADVYEATKLLNIPLGFTTSSELSNINKNEQVVIIPPTQYLSDADLSALQQFAAIGGKVALVSEDNSFEFNERGKKRGSFDASFSSHRFSFGAIADMADNLKQTLSPYFPDLPLDIEVKNQQGQTSYGVLAHQANQPDSDRQILSLINTSQQTMNIQINGHNGKVGDVSNVINSKELTGDIVLEPMGVVLLSIDANSVAEAQNDSSSDGGGDNTNNNAPDQNEAENQKAHLAAVYIG